MRFAYPLPWWLAALTVSVIGGLTFAAYRRLLVPLSRSCRAALIACRAVVLIALVLLLFRPIVLVPRAGNSAVPVLVDVSRSMRVNDAEGQTRLARARSILDAQLWPALSASRFVPQLYTVGDRLAPAAPDRLRADASRSDLDGGLLAVREKSRGQPIAGIVLLSDGGDSARRSVDDPSPGPPVFAIGLGRPEIRDREVTAVAAGDPRLDQASVDLRVSLVSSGFGRTPFQLRLSANGREVERRRVVPPADGASIQEVFTVSPDPAVPTLYRAEIAPDAAESVTENNVRSVLVNPAGRKRRLLVVAGAPGFEHSFMQRAWARDPSLEADIVVRKGRNAEGQDTFFVQAAADRAGALARGFPSRREDLYAYDALVLANIEADFFTRDQLAMSAEFVAERGGGLLVVGGRAFAQRGLTGTPLENVLPVELTDRRGLPAASSGRVDAPARNKVIVTPEGESHPAVRIGNTVEETRRLWSALPALAATAPLGGPRPGATVLAVTSGAAGGVYPVVAVQQYGRGRSMVVAGEASWRWRMMLPSNDRSYEFVWRQAARWLAGSSPDPVSAAAPDDIEAGQVRSVDVEIRDAAFVPVADAVIDARLTGPDGETRPLPVRRTSGASGRFTTDVLVGQDGLYRLGIDARRGASSLGSVVQWIYVGAVDREFVDPRLNEAWLRRVARSTGGRYVRAAEASRVVDWLKEVGTAQAVPERRDVWHQPWVFALIAAMLSTEWILRRRWGLR